MISLARIVVIVFGIFMIGAGILMLIKPKVARSTLRKAGSTNLINYAEITIRMLPAIGMVVYANYSKFPDILRIFGGFMIATSLVLYVIPRKVHHNFSLKCAEFLKPNYFQMVSPIAIISGLMIIYSVI